MIQGPNKLAIASPISPVLRCLSSMQTGQAMDEWKEAQLPPCDSRELR